MSAFYHLGAVVSVFLAYLIFTRKDKEVSDYILAIWLICSGANLFLYHRIIDHEEIYNILIAINFGILLLHGAAFYIYVKAMINTASSFSIKNLLHFIPLVVFILYITILYISNNTNKIPLLYNNISIQSHIEWNIFATYAVCSIPVYLVLSYRILKKYDKSILDNYSSTEEAELDWLKRCISGIAITWLVYIVLEILPHFTTFIPRGESLKYAFYLFSLMIFYLGIYGIKKTTLFINQYIQPLVTTKINNLQNNGLKKNKTIITEVEQEEYIQKLKEYMFTNKPYLKSRLSIKDLSDESKIPSLVISQLIKFVLNKNFYEFVNDYRVEEFIKRSSSDSNTRFTLIGIAMECGFSSKSTFYSIFKKHKGFTPQEYIKLMAKKD